MQTEHKDNFSEMQSRLHCLIVYKGLTDNFIVSKFAKLLENLVRESQNKYLIQQIYSELLSDLLKEGYKLNLTGNLWQEYLFQLIALNENSFSLSCESDKFKEEGLLYDAALHDVEILKNLLLFKWEYLSSYTDRPVLLNAYFDAENNNLSKQNHHFLKLKKAFLEGTTMEALKSLVNFYRNVGCGKPGVYIAFRWEKERGLIGIKDYDPITFNDLIGYEEQKNTLIENTKAFLRKNPANNLLLFGDRGTGKSSSVKALLNEFYIEGLRMVEVTKSQLKHFNEILDCLRGRAQRYIIFIDDLSFEDFEVEYKHLKALIEGGLEVKPDNVLIYATSNRRHLIRETWVDREKQAGDVHVTDTMQEKLSLVDRFGITIAFTSPDQEQYLEIVRGLADKNNIEIPYLELKEQAIKWAMWHNGRSGRTAKQFIDYLLGTL